MRYGTLWQLKIICALTIAAAIIGCAVKATAQTQAPPDPVFMNAVISTLENQRNSAQTSHALSEAREAVLKDQVAKLQARITELEKLAAVKPKEGGQ